MTATDDVSCWICLESGPNESGALRRDCSCRGEAGWAHLSCLTEFARRQSKNPKTGSKPWWTCWMCKQKHQRQLALDLVNNGLAFVEKEMPVLEGIPLLDSNDANQSRHMIKLEMLNVKLDTIVGMDFDNDARLRSEGKSVANRVLAMARTAIPLYEFLCKTFQVNAFNALGNLTWGESDGNELSILYWEKMRDLARENGNKLAVDSAEVSIAKTRVANERGGPLSVERTIAQHRKIYSEYLEKRGEDAFSTLDIGSQLADALHRSYHVVEAIRLMQRLVDTSRRVHGPGRHQTKEMEGALRHYRGNRLVGLKSRLLRGKRDRFVALRYEDGGARCVVRGPLARPGDPGGEVFDVPTADVLISPGTPVVPVGLKNARHLNGKLGDVRGRNPGNGRFRVHFEDARLRPNVAEVRNDNLRIVFDLPDRDTGDDPPEDNVDETRGMLDKMKVGGAREKGTSDTSDPLSSKLLI